MSTAQNRLEQAHAPSEGSEDTTVSGVGASATRNLKLLTTAQQAEQSGVKVLQLPNDADPLAGELDLEGVARIELSFPKFTDGRAFSQAYLLRRRLRFAGDIRATGDVLIDQLVQMQRSGFSSAVLREGVDPAAAQRQFDRYAGFYQGDAVQTAPHFAATAKN